MSKSLVSNWFYDSLVFFQHLPAVVRSHVQSNQSVTQQTRQILWKCPVIENSSECFEMPLNHPVKMIHWDQIQGFALQQVNRIVVVEAGQISLKCLHRRLKVSVNCYCASLTSGPFSAFVTFVWHLSTYCFQFGLNRTTRDRDMPTMTLDSERIVRLLNQI